MNDRLLEFIERHGFAIVVAVWLLVRTDRRLGRVAVAIEGLRRAIEVRWPIKGDLGSFLTASRETPDEHEHAA